MDDMDAKPNQEIFQNISDVNNQAQAQDNNAANILDLHKLDMLNDVTINLSIEIGRSPIKIRNLLNLTQGSIIELDKAAGDPVDIYANGRLIANGTIITTNGKYCVRLTSVPTK